MGEKIYLNRLLFNNIKLLQRILTKYYETNNEGKVDSVHGF